MAEKTTRSAKSLRDCPLEILEELFTYLDPSTLYEMTMAFPQFEDIISTPRCWKHNNIDARHDNNNTDEKNQYCIDKINKFTTHVCIRGKVDGYGRIPDNFTKQIGSLSNLKVIALENQKLDGSEVSLEHFPGCLEELSIKNSLVEKPKFFFRNSNKSMRSLRVLIVDGCRWLDNSYFKWISRYRKLEIFSAAHCLNSEFHVAYIWKTENCKRLRVIDYRFSLPAFGGDLIDTWTGVKPLHIMYFQSISSAEEDYGVKIKYDRTLYSSPWNVENEINDESFQEYVDWILGRDVTDKLPESYLYKDPYPECTCNYKQTGQNSDGSQPQAASSSYCFTAFHQEAEAIDWDRMDRCYKNDYEDSDSEVESDESESQLKVKALRKLSLRGFKKVTDKCLCYISPVPLDLLDVTGTAVTGKGIEDFLVRYPNCRVIHPLYCICKPISPF